MTVTMLVAPTASEGPAALADWLELRALEAADGNSSLQDLVQVIRRAGTIEAVEPDDEDEVIEDRGAEKSQAVAEDAFTEIEDRLVACGGMRGGYPFRVSAQFIELRRDPRRFLYLFLLLLARFGKDAGPKGSDGAKLFELVCVQAAAAYFGGRGSGVSSYHFGAPRRLTPRRFVDALNDVCRQMGEGQGCRVDRPNLKDQKDAKLDLIVWRPFLDGRPGKLMGFGQCATGADWPDKLTHLQPEHFCQQWMLDTPAVSPIRLFFAPFRIEHRRWRDVTGLGGIIFDRCRIAVHARSLDRNMLDECAEWTNHALRENLES